MILLLALDELLLAVQEFGCGVALCLLALVEWGLHLMHLRGPERDEKFETTGGE